MEPLSVLGVKVKELACDLNSANTLIKTFYAICYAQRIGLPCIWTILESELWRTYSQFLPKQLETQTLERFQYFYASIFVSAQARKDFKTLDTQDNFQVIPNGLSPTGVC